MNTPNGLVLIWVEDVFLAQYLERLYQREGFKVQLCAHYLQLKRELKARELQPTAIVISLGEPLKTSLKYCQQLHQMAPFACLLALTPGQEPASGQAALKSGADDYLFLPIQAQELLARTDAHLCRSMTILAARLKPQTAQVLNFGGLQLVPAKQQAVFNKQVSRLSPNEFKLLHLLALHANQYLSRAELHKGLWQAPESSGSRRLDNFILALRKKLPAEIKILTNYGQGYCLQIPD